MEEEESKVSKYSSGINILKRIDNLWKDTHTHSRMGLFKSWNNDLDRIWLELARDLKEKSKNKEIEFEGVRDKFNKFDEDITKIGNFEDNPPEGFQPVPKDSIAKRNEHYKKLMEKQLFLARLENVLGKGTTVEDEDDDDF